MSIVRALRLLVGFVTVVTLLLASCGPSPATPTPTPAPAPEPVSTPPPAPAPPPPKPASFSVSDLAITPGEVTSGSSVTIRVTVNNTGELMGAYEVILKIDGVRESAQTVTLVGGASKRVEFKTAKYSAGTYSVTVDDLKNTFMVKAAPAPVTSAPPTPAAPAAPAWTKRLTANATAVNPTWDELITFLAKDTTNLIEYGTALFSVTANVSLEQAITLQNNAEKAGIKSGVVVVRLGQGSLFANVFVTSDYGQVYIQSMVDDSIVRIERGEPYLMVNLNAIRPSDLGSKYAWDYAIQNRQGRVLLGAPVIESSIIYWSR